ncbi:ubiquitin carboxyl-terminal hydrolase 47 [Galendromus occidentalis]|uniref:Ubiquitin carboxyl-terminal hydrolase n=1 Tax=Galendromus occidentalis TaxID=34638 RepID=A0AAJ6VZP4_9ACAR|nr:ubiquitin carboxyl-terminal hydrolase 47 [Galendromus occidentalis]
MTVSEEMMPAGLVNQAMTCYLNSVLQTLFYTPEFRNALYACDFSAEENPTKSIPCQLQRLFLRLQCYPGTAAQTISLTRSFGWDSHEAWQQHDVQELCRVMFDALEGALKKSGQQADLIERLYQGSLKDYVKCTECNNESAREDHYQDIALVVRPFGSDKIYGSLIEALNGFVEPETLNGANQYHCEKCKKKCDALKGLKFVSFPKILTLQLKRFDFDYLTMRRIKLNDRVEFPEVLDLNGFIESKPPKTEYVYDLFAVLIHSGSANGGHYYAYIRNKTDWFCFNDNQVHRVTLEDVQRTFGGGGSTDTRSPFSSSTNAYMLIYRQQSEANAQAMTEDDFGEHLRELRRTLSEEDEFLRDKAEKDSKLINLKLFHDHLERRRWIERQWPVDKDAKLGESMEVIKAMLGIEAPTECCRLVLFDDASEAIEKSLEDSMEKPVAEIFGNVQPYYRSDILVEVREPDETFEEYVPGGHTFNCRQVNLKYDEVKRPFRVYLTSQHTFSDIADRIQKRLGREPEDFREEIEHLRICYEEPNGGDIKVLDHTSDTKIAELKVGRSMVIYFDIEESDDCKVEDFQSTELFGIIDALRNTVCVNCNIPKGCTVNQHDDIASKCRRFLRVWPYKDYETGEQNLRLYIDKRISMDQLKLNLQPFLGTEIQTLLKMPSMVELEAPSMLLDDQRLEIVTDPSENISKDQRRLKVYRLSLEAEAGSLVGYVTEFMYPKTSKGADVREIMAKKLSLLYPNEAPPSEKIRMRKVNDKMPSSEIILDDDIFDVTEVYIEVLSEKERFARGKNRVVYLQEFRTLTRTWNTAAEILVKADSVLSDVEAAINKISGSIEVLSAVENGQEELKWREGISEIPQDAILLYYVDKSKWESKQMVIPPRPGIKMTEDEENSIRSRRWISSKKERALKIDVLN